MTGTIRQTRRLMQLLAVIAVIGAVSLVSLDACAAPAQNGGNRVSTQSTKKLVARGEYLTRAGDCISCHTARAGKPFAGGRAIATPFGDIFAPNITPDVETGIGSWTFTDFWKALHEGKNANGDLLYPAFPYTSYTKVTRADAKAIFAYLKTVPPVTQRDHKPDLRFPYNVRTGLHLWRGLYFNKGVYQANPDKSKQWNRGAYLVEGLGHCNECHTQRNWLGGMAPGKFLAGGNIPVQGWYAPDLSMQAGGGLEGWSQQDVVDFLKKGQSSKAAAYGPMADVVRMSTQYLTDNDLKAMAVYLDSLPAPEAGDSAYTGKASNYSQGEAIYADQCASCHGKEGQGVSGAYPPLDGNKAVTMPKAINAIRNVLLGGFPPSTQENPYPYSMPPFASKLNDKEVAAVINYIRQSWSNQGQTIHAEDVQHNRYFLE